MALRELPGRIVRGAPALSLAAVTLVGKPVSFVGNLLASAVPSGLADRLLAMPFKNSKSAMLRGDLEKVARDIWPEKEFPTLYVENIRDDIRREPWGDGRLWGGLPISWLAHKHLTKAVLDDAARRSIAVGVSGAVGVGLLSLALTAIAGYSAVNLENLPVAADVWPGEGLEGPGFIWQIRLAVAQALSGVGDLPLTAIAAALAIPAALLIGPFLHVRAALEQTNGWYAIPTKDAITRYRSRAAKRALLYKAYVKQVMHDTKYLADSPTIPIAVATGLIRERGDLTAPMAGTPVCLDFESLGQHVGIMGGTGSGKTSAFARPMCRKILAHNNWGAYFADAKGVLGKDLLDMIVNDLGRGDDVRMIGVGETDWGIDLMSGMDPAQYAFVLGSLVRQMGNAEAIWVEGCANLSKHIGRIAQVYDQTPEGKAKADRLRVKNYSIWGIYSLARTPIGPGVQGYKASELDKILGYLANLRKEMKASGDTSIPELMSPQFKSSYDWLNDYWRTLAPDTKSGVMTYLQMIMDGFGDDERLKQRFASGYGDRVISIREALEGKILMTSMTTVQFGSAARLCLMLIKTALYREARLREQEIGSKECQKRPCLFLSDEHQESATFAAGNGLTDDFLNVARSTGVSCVFLTQSVIALEQAIGEKEASNLFHQLRTKVFLTMECQKTIDYAIWLAGTQPQSEVIEPDHHASIESMITNTKFNPLRITAEGESAPVAGLGTLARMAWRNAANEDPLALDDVRTGELHAVDMRFVSEYEENENSGTDNQDTIDNQLRDAHNRAQDLTRSTLQSGNEDKPVLNVDDMTSASRWFAFIYWQRAGISRKDLCEITHEYK